MAANWVLYSILWCTSQPLTGVAWKLYLSMHRITVMSLSRCTVLSLFRGSVTPGALWSNLPCFTEITVARDRGSLHEQQLQGVGPACGHTGLLTLTVWHRVKVTGLVNTLSTTQCQGTYCNNTYCRYVWLKCFLLVLWVPGLKVLLILMLYFYFFFYLLVLVMLNQIAKIFLYNQCIITDDIVAESSARTLTCTSCFVCLIVVCDQTLSSGSVTGNCALVHSKVGRTSNIIQRSLWGLLFSYHFPLRDFCLHYELVLLSAWRKLMLSGAYSSQQNVNWSYFIQAEIQGR